MVYEVVEARFRTELEARWSVFFDYLEVPYTYEPATFKAGDGSVCTPAFWLPRERLWFVAALETAPPWWCRFAAAASNQGWVWDTWKYSDEEDEETDVDPTPFAVGEQWQGSALLSLGGIPDGYARSPHLTQGPWREHHFGMYTENDCPYQWTLCPECGSFGATFWGYAERLPCRCIDDHVRHKVANGADERLLVAYRAAAKEDITIVPDPGSGTAVAVREALARQEDTALVAECCTGNCQSVGERLRAELPVGAYMGGIVEGSDVLCGECPGFVCTRCGQQPAAAAGAACRECDPLVLLTYDRTRQVLNTKAGEAAHAVGRSAREINTLLNRETRARNRAHASMEQLAQALTLVDSWIADPSQIPPTGTARRPVLSEDELDTLHGKELNQVLSQWVGPLAAATGRTIPLVQLWLNDVMGVEKRSEANDEQLREAIWQAQAWVQDPASYTAYLHAAQAEVPSGGLPEPLSTRLARAESTCNLCTSPVAEGDVIGRLHAPIGRRFARMGWLCAHCLHDRRTKPRRLDVILRIFHHTFSGGGVRLNSAEAEVLLRWLLDLPEPAEADREAVQDALVALGHGIDDEEPSLLLRYQPTQSLIRTLYQSLDPVATDEQSVVLNAVAQHLAEWHDNPQCLDPAHYTSRVAWRRAILEQTEYPTVLSQRGGPFFV
ncbi:hypothetical protein [Streptomyces luteireticuli]|uniref:hypothetical protein n=1 Tax=Streptomyces luteireticuli TaxID=173858 RepID=UPI003557246E